MSLPSEESNDNQDQRNTTNGTTSHGKKEPRGESLWPEKESTPRITEQQIQNDDEKNETNQMRKEDDRMITASPPPPPRKKTSSSSSSRPATTTLTAWHVRQALLWFLFFPWLVLVMTSTFHEHISIQNNDNQDSVWPRLTRRLVQSRILLLGFQSSAHLWRTLYERFLSVLCWGLCFVLVRKGWNISLYAARRPTGSSVVRRYWKGATLSTLSILYSTLARTVLSPGHWGYTSKSLPSPLQQALWIGLTWAMGNALIRRRLDPRATLGDATTLRDLIFGALSFAAAAYGKTWTQPYLVVIPRTWCCAHMSIPVPVQSAMDYVFGILSSSSSWKFWQTWWNAVHNGLWYSVTYLLIRRGANPDFRRDFVRRYGADAFYGGVALIVGAYLKLALSHWFPYKWWWLWWSLSSSSSTSSSQNITLWGDASDTTLNDGMDDEL